MSGSKFIPAGSSLVGHGQCKVCREVHPSMSKCDRMALVRRIMVLEKTHNDNHEVYQQLLAHNEALVEQANSFRQMSINTSKTILLIQETIEGIPGGKELWSACEKRLKEQWEIDSSSRATSQATSSQPENTTQSETESKPCIEVTMNGETTEPGSLH